MTRLSRLFRLIGGIFDAFMSMLSNTIPSESQLESGAEQMLSELNKRAEVTSYQMALADTKHEELRRELANNEALQRQAVDFYREKNEAAARRCVTLKVQSAKRVEQLTLEYNSVQQAAELATTEFMERKKSIESKIRQIPQLQQDTRLIQMQKQIENMTGRFTLESGEHIFDEAREELRIKKLQLENRALLTSDPNLALDRQINSAIEEKEINTAMDELAKQAMSEGVIEAEFTVVKENSVAEARKLLEAPRYQGIFRENDTREREFIPRKSSGGS